MKFKFAMLAVAGLISLNACNKPAEQPVEQAAPVDAAAQAQAAAPAEAFPAARDHFAQEFEAKLVQVAPRIEAMKTKAAEATGEAKVAMEQEVATMVAKLGTMQADLAAVKAATETTWQEIQGRLTTTMTEIEAGLNKPAAPATAN